MAEHTGVDPLIAAMEAAETRLFYQARLWRRARNPPWTQEADFVEQVARDIHSAVASARLRAEVAALSETKEPQPDEWKQFKDMLSKKIFASANTVASFVAGGGLNRLRASRVQVSDPNPKETR